MDCENIGNKVALEMLVASVITVVIVAVPIGAFYGLLEDPGVGLVADLRH